MNHQEESLLLNSKLGESIAQWGYVEGHLLNIVKRCTLREGDAVAASYLQIENFRSKLAFCDNLMVAKAGREKWFHYWKKVRDRCSSLAVKRNQLVHGWHSLYVQQPSGKRFAIIPTLVADGKLVHRDGAKPPNGSLFLRDVVMCRMEFFALTQQTCNAYEMLCGGRVPFPKADEPVCRPPTIRTIENQMRVELGRQPRPSRKSPRNPEFQKEN